MDITNPKKAALIAEYDLDEKFPQIVQADAGEPHLDLPPRHDRQGDQRPSDHARLVLGRRLRHARRDRSGKATLRRRHRLRRLATRRPPSRAYRGAGGQRPPVGVHPRQPVRHRRRRGLRPVRLVATNDDDGTAITPARAATPQLEEGETITGPSVFVGRACPGDPAVPAGDAGTQIAVVERGVCTFTEKVAAVEAAGGYEAVLVFNRTASDGCNGTARHDRRGRHPGVRRRSARAGFAIFDVEASTTMPPAWPATARSWRRSRSAPSVTR